MKSIFIIIIILMAVTIILLIILYFIFSIIQFFRKQWKIYPHISYISIKPRMTFKMSCFVWSEAQTPNKFTLSQYKTKKWSKWPHMRSWIRSYLPFFATCLDWFCQLLFPKMNSDQWNCDKMLSISRGLSCFWYQVIMSLQGQWWSKG